MEPPVSVDRPDQPDHQIVDALVQTSFVVMGILTRVAAEHGLSLTQLRVLGILRDRQLRMAQLAAYLGVDRSSLSGLVARAEERGLLERTKDEHDGRGTVVHMTAAGLREAAQVHAQVTAELTPLIGTLTERARETLATDLSGFDLVTRPRDAPSASTP